MTYVDAMLCAVPSANREAYREHGETTAKIFREYGALKVVDCWGDSIPEGELTSLPLAVKCKEDETVCLSWILWPSKEVREEAWPKLMADARMSPGSMPFDGKRMIFGAFEMIVDA